MQRVLLHRSQMAVHLVSTKTSFQTRCVSNYLPARIRDMFRPDDPNKPIDLSVVAIPPVESTDEYREGFIPLTRRSLIREIMQDKQLLRASERDHFEDLTLSLDASVMNRYHGILQELKQLFDPLNPDKETLGQKKYTRRDRLDSEFWLLQRLGHVITKANFRELTKQEVEYALSEHRVDEGVKVSVNPSRYDVLKFWALGKESPLPPVTVWTKLWSRLRPYMPGRWSRTAYPQESRFFYKRVVVAVRLKRDDKLLVKIFKDIPINALEQLLPDGRITMSHMDRVILTSTVTLGSLGLLLKTASYIADFNLQWSLVLAGVAGMVGFRSWTTYKNRRLRYMLRLNQMLYYKNVANNRGLLTLLADRAEDECFKEALLAYTFLLANREPGNETGHDAGNLPAGVIGGISAGQLERNIEAWVASRCGSAITKIEFDSEEALNLLQSLGIVHTAGDGADTLFCLNIPAALGLLPQAPKGLLPVVRHMQTSEGEETEGFELVGAGLPGHIAQPDTPKEDRERLREVGWK